MDTPAAQGNSRIEKVKEDLRTLAHDAEDLIKATAEDMSEKAKGARARLSEAIARARVTCDQLEQRSIAAAKATDQTIREHPYESVGIAFFVGLLTGVLMTRK